MTILAPALLAATVFSLNPPIRSTFPVTVNSPVIAILGSNARSNPKLNKLVAIVIPALGPSFCTAPSGQCICTRAFSKNLFPGNFLAINPLAKLYAITVLSFITAFRLPVRSNPGREEWDSAFSRMLSTYSAAPPICVQARPMATPGGVVSYRRSEVKTGGRRSRLGWRR